MLGCPLAPGTRGPLSDVFEKIHVDVERTGVRRELMKLLKYVIVVFPGYQARNSLEDV